MVKQIGYGSVISVTTTTAELNIGQVRSIDGPLTAANSVDTTCLDSTTNYRTFIQGLVDPGEVTLDVVLDTTSVAYERLVNYHANRTQKTYAIYIGSSTGDALQMTAHVSGIGPAIPLDELVTAEITLKASGDPGLFTS